MQGSKRRGGEDAQIEEEVTEGERKGAVAKEGGELRSCGCMGGSWRERKGRGVLSDTCPRGDKDMEESRGALGIL